MLKVALQTAIVLAVLVLFTGPAGTGAYSIAFASHFNLQANSNSFVISPNYSQAISIQLYTGMNASFQVSSNATVDVYFMTLSQYSNFQSTGAAQSIYHSEGTYITANIGPLVNGTYYLVMDNDVSSQNVSVSYSLSTVPVNVYSYHSSLPAPVGIADYGVMNSSGTLHPYRIFYREAIGIAQIYSMQAYNSSPPVGISPYGASLQQNVVLQVNTTSGNYEYWLQNVPSFWTNNETMYFADNVWNLSAFTSYLSNQTVSGKGQVGYSGNDTYYGYGTSPQPYSLPLTLYLIIAYTQGPNSINVGFGYAYSQNSQVTWYDNVTIYEHAIVSAALEVNGYQTNPGGSFYDSELVFGGEGSSEQTNFNQMNSTLSMMYVLPNGTVISPPAIYGFGSDTAEAADNLQTKLVNGIPNVTVGRGNFEPLGRSTGIFGAAFSINVPTVDAGMSVPVHLTSSESNGIAPFTYYIYLNGIPVYNFTTFLSQYAGTISIKPMPAGTYDIQVEAVDALGRVAHSNTYTFTVNPDPSISISSNVSSTDLGFPVGLSLTVSNGTPPYTYQWYVNGQRLATDSSSLEFNPDAAGSYIIKSVVIDSAGYTVLSTTNITVESDPKMVVTPSLSSSGIFYVNNIAEFSVKLQGGVSPFNYTWYLNGNPVATTASPLYTYALGIGTNSLQVRATDSVGYSVVSQPVVVNTTYNYLIIGAIVAAILAIIIIIVALAAIFIKKRTLH